MIRNTITESTCGYDNGTHIIVVGGECGGVHGRRCCREIRKATVCHTHVTYVEIAGGFRCRESQGNGRIIGCVIMAYRGRRNEHDWVSAIIRPPKGI